MKTVINCVICGRPAHAVYGHVHIGEERANARFCAEHGVQVVLAGATVVGDYAVNCYEGCSKTCYGEYREWMGLTQKANSDVDFENLRKHADKIREFRSNPSIREILDF